MVSPLDRVAYIRFVSRAVAAANRKWRLDHPNRGDVLMERDVLHAHLFGWAVRTGLISDPGKSLKTIKAAYVAMAFRDDPEAVQQEARAYYRRLIKSRLEPSGVED